MSKQSVNINSTEFQPKNEYILVKPEIEPAEKKSEGGIIMMNTKTSVLERPSSGVVVAHGESVEDLSVGDFLLWPMTDGIDIEFADGDFMLLRYESIIGSKK